MSDDTPTGDDMRALLEQQNTHDKPDAEPEPDANDDGQED